MDWKNIIKLDFSGNAGSRTRKDEDNKGKKVFNPFDPTRKKRGGEVVDHSEPEGGIPENKCDGWPDCKLDAVKYCGTCCFKACEGCYPLFAAAKGGYHPSRAMNNPSRPYHENCADITSAGGKKERKVVEHDEDTGYSTGADW
jgi:hypothetical protein